MEHHQHTLEKNYSLVDFFSFFCSANPMKDFTRTWINPFLWLTLSIAKQQHSPYTTGSNPRGAVTLGDMRRPPNSQDSKQLPHNAFCYFSGLSTLSKCWLLVSNDAKASNNVVHAYVCEPWKSLCMGLNSSFLLLDHSDVCWTFIQGHAHKCSWPASALLQ